MVEKRERAAGQVNRLKWLAWLFACVFGVYLVYHGSLLTLLYPFSYPALIAATAYCAYRLSGWKSVGGLVALVMVAVPVIEISAGPLAMGRICREGDPGTTVFERASDVGGFFTNFEPGCGGTCKGALMEHGFDFVEGRVSEEVAERLKRETTYRGRNLIYLAVQPGLYRFSLIPDEHHPDCEIFEAWLAKVRPRDRGEYKGVCIATLPIKAKTARFEHTYEVAMQPARLGKIKIRTDRIIDREKEKVLAQYVHYSWVEEPIFKIHEMMTAPISCPLVTVFHPWDALSS